MSKISIFSVRINGGKEQTLECVTGIYQQAAAAAIAMLEYEESEHAPIVEIWAPTVFPYYGPYFYEVGSDKFGNLVVKSLIARDGAPPGEVRRLYR